MQSPRILKGSGLLEFRVIDNHEEVLAPGVSNLVLNVTKVFAFRLCLNNKMNK